MNDRLPLQPGQDGMRTATVSGPAGRITFDEWGHEHDGTPVVLLHGYPQSRACWSVVGPALGGTHRVIAPDLRGYGASDGPVGGPKGEGYTKREMALDVVALLDALGIERAHIAGHDRGARVAYRFALDHPQRTETMTALDILPTIEQFELLSGTAATGTYHWYFLAQPGGLPERLLSNDPEFFIRHTLNSWWGGPGAPEGAIQRDAATFTDRTIEATCADYRAGLHLDTAIDRADRDTGRRMAMPVLVIHGDRGRVAAHETMEARTRAVWERWADDLTIATLPCGHFLAEEQPEALTTMVRAFLDAHAPARTGSAVAAEPVPAATDLLYLRDAELRIFEANVLAVDGMRVALNRTAFYPTGGGQPHDTGTLDDARVVDVRKEGETVWHTLEGVVPPVGATVHGAIDWDRRHKLMRTHTALHVLCGVIWNRWRVAVTGGNMEPLQARMDFEFDPLPDGFAVEVEALVNEELRADRQVRVEFLPQAAAHADPELIRTKVNMIPAHVAEIRVVDIAGLDRQADGGTHVASTAEVGRVRVVKTESKGKGNKRLRIELD
jgi:Ser-tRNA(Ala) deacylase AlaX/pimeloyl-ACP methyl ester carboxylesterase